MYCSILGKAPTYQISMYQLPYKCMQFTCISQAVKVHVSGTLRYYTHTNYYIYFISEYSLSHSLLLSFSLFFFFFVSNHLCTCMHPPLFNCWSASYSILDISSMCLKPLSSSRDLLRFHRDLFGSDLLSRFAPNRDGLAMGGEGEGERLSLSPCNHRIKSVVGGEGSSSKTPPV